jgi:hypothetical protein
VNAPQGRCYWAIAPFSPASPFRLYAGTEHEPIPATTRSMVTAARTGGDPQFDAIVAVKARPILVLTETLQPFGEVLALRLRTFDKLTAADQKRVREQQDDGLFHLDPARFSKLPQENAAIVTALLRLPVSAIDTSEEHGVLNTNELRVVHERVARAHGLNLDLLALGQAQRLIERMRSRDR